MPLSPQEERALAALEEELADDPALAAVLAATPSARPSYLPSARTTLHVVSLLAALGALIAVGDTRRRPPLGPGRRHRGPARSVARLGGGVAEALIPLATVAQ